MSLSYTGAHGFDRRTTRRYSLPVSLHVPKRTFRCPMRDLVRKILTEGTLKSDRTGTGTISLFGQQMRFDLSKYFPLLTTKTVFFKGLAYELLWFLKGSSNINWLLEHNVHIWDEWADENGDLGPVYGVQWRSWPAADPRGPESHHRPDLQCARPHQKHHPDSRRMIVSAWNPAEVEKMALPPCHALFQFYVADGKLSCQLYQRSCDMFLGVPFNIASYSLLTMMMAQQTGPAGRIRLDRRRLPCLRQPRRPVPGAAGPQAPPVPDHRDP